MIYIAKSKTATTPKTKKKPKSSTWKFDTGDEVIYLGGMTDEKYQGQKCVVIDRSRGKIIEYYKIQFEDGESVTTKDSALRKVEEVEV